MSWRHHISCFAIQIFLFAIFSVCHSQTDKSDSVKVIYLGNEGFLIESGEKKVLIDALFTKGAPDFTVPAPQTCSQIVKGESPYSNTDLLLITHDHNDHYDSLLIDNYLLQNNQRHVLCSHLLKEKLSKMINYIKYKDRIIAVTPPFYSSSDTAINNIRIKVLRLRHQGSDGTDVNLGYIVNLNGINIFHTGDNNCYFPANQPISAMSEYQRIGIDSTRIDIAILNNGFLWDEQASGVEVVKQFIKPKHIILCHFMENEWSNDYVRIKKVISDNQSWMPDVFIPRNSLESISY